MIWNDKNRKTVHPGENRHSPMKMPLDLVIFNRISKFS